MKLEAVLTSECPFAEFLCQSTVIGVGPTVVVEPLSRHQGLHPLMKGPEINVTTSE